MNNTSDLSNVLSGKNKIGVDVSIDKESALILALVLIGAIIIGSVTSKMLSNLFSL